MIKQIKNAIKKIPLVYKLYKVCKKCVFLFYKRLTMFSYKINFIFGKIFSKFYKRHNTIFLKRYINSKKEVVIVTMPQNLYDARLLSDFLLAYGIRSSMLLYNETGKLKYKGFKLKYNRNTLYIVFSAMMAKNMPKHYILYNMEYFSKSWYQEMHWYIKRMNKSILIFDYCRANLSFLKDRINKEWYFLPISSLHLYDSSIPKKQQVLFVGAVSERRKPVLDNLAKITNLKINTEEQSGQK